MKIEKSPIKSNRIRKIKGSFAFIEHTFLRKGYWTSLEHQELLLYFFLVLVSDKEGLSYYGYERICEILRIRLDQFLSARNSLIEKDLIAFDGTLFTAVTRCDRCALAGTNPPRGGFVPGADTALQPG